MMCKLAFWIGFTHLRDADLASTAHVVGYLPRPLQQNKRSVERDVAACRDACQQTAGVSHAWRMCSFHLTLQILYRESWPSPPESLKQSWAGKVRWMSLVMTPSWAESCGSKKELQSGIFGSLFILSKKILNYFDYYYKTYNT